MRVLHLVTHFWPAGGSESFLVDTFRRLHQPDLHMEVCCAGPTDRTTPEIEAELRVKVWSCRFARNPLSFMRRFERELRQRGPYDVVHTHISNFGGPALAVARKLGVPTRLAHYHNLKAGHRDDWARRLVEHWVRGQVLRDATGILALTYGGLRELFPAQWETDPRMHVVRYGVDVARFAGVNARAEIRRELNIPLDAPVVGHVGRFAWQKNHVTLIAAAARVIRERPATRFVLVGDGDLRPQVAEQARALGIAENVIFTGLRRDVPRVLSALDVFFFPSVVEGFGKAQLEAQASGLPVVASNIVTSFEAIAPAFREYLCDPLDAEGMAAALLKLLERAAADAQLSQQARDFAALFTMEASVQSVLAAWGYPGASAPPDPFAPRAAALAV